MLKALLLLLPATSLPVSCSILQSYVCWHYPAFAQKQMSKGDIVKYPSDFRYIYQVSKIYFLLKGSYSNSSGKTFDVNFVYIYNMETQKLEVSVLANEELIRGYFRALVNVE